MRLPITYIAVGKEPSGMPPLEQYFRETAYLWLMARVNNMEEAKLLLTTAAIDAMVIFPEAPDGPVAFLTLCQPSSVSQVVSVCHTEMLPAPYDYMEFFRITEQVFFFRQVLDEKLSYPPPAPNAFFHVRWQQQRIKVGVHDIQLVETVADLCVLHLRDEHIMTTDSMEKIASHLPEACFYRVNRKYLAGLGHIHKLGVYYIQLQHMRIPLRSDRYEQALQAWFRYKYLTHPLRTSYQIQS